MRALAILAIAATCAGCTDRVQNVYVTLPGDPARATRVEVSVLPSCDGVTLGDEPEGALRTGELVDGQSDPLGAITPGRYGLYGRAWQAGCLLYAAGCQDVRVGTDTSSVAVTLMEIDERSCRLGEQCVGERCIGGESPDAAVDAAPPRDCGDVVPCADALTDDFTDEATSTAWIPAGADGCTILETNGELVIAPPSLLGEYGFCVYTSATVYELTGAAVTVEVNQTTSSDPAAETFLSLSRSDGVDLVIMTKIGPELTLLVGTDVMAVLPYEPTTHHWWRIRERDGIVYWEASPDAQAWQELMNAPEPVGLDRALLSIGAGTNQSIENPGVAHFDNFNLPSP